MGPGAEGLDAGSEAMRMHFNEWRSQDSHLRRLRKLVRQMYL